ncbi:hypothetical protein RYD26_01785 [Pasteurellaceae bacterium LIM206]|nr:hypothetical protein [Pasteurellaceae bacterium LIM206]
MQVLILSSELEDISLNIINHDENEAVDISYIRTAQEIDDLRFTTGERYDRILVSKAIIKEYCAGEDGRIRKLYLATFIRLLKPDGYLYLQHDYITSDELGIMNHAVQHMTISDNTVEIQRKDHIEVSEQLTFQYYLEACLLNQHNRTEDTEYYYTALRCFQEDGIIAGDLLSFYLRYGNLRQLLMLWDNYILKYKKDNYLLMKAFSLLHYNQYYEGFKFRELALHEFPPSRRCPCNPPREEIMHKRWTGQLIEDKTFVVWSEFGLGDELMFAQLAFVFKRHLKVGKLIFITQEPLVAVLKTHPDIDEVIALSQANTLEDFDYWEWPHALLSHINKPNDFADLPKRHPYLFADAQKIAKSAPHFTSDKALKIGLVWRGSPTHENDKFRSIHRVELLDQLLDIPNINWYCMQKALNEREQAWLKKHNIPTFSDEMLDFSDTAAMLTQLDLLISVDTSIVHLAGAMNIPTFLMLPVPYDWRWGMPDSQNLWYPSVRSFFADYQNLRAGLLQVIPKVKAALSRLVKDKDFLAIKHHSYSIPSEK